MGEAEKSHRELAGAVALGTAFHQQNCPDILSFFESVKKLNPDRWVARCVMPDHDDKTPSLYITRKSNGAFLMYCHGCGAKGIDVCSALGIPASSLYPPALRSNVKRYTDNPSFQFVALRSIQDDLIRLVVIANMLSEADTLSESDRQFIADLSIKLSNVITGMEGAK